MLRNSLFNNLYKFNKKIIDKLYFELSYFFYSLRAPFYELKFKKELKIRSNLNLTQVEYLAKNLPNIKTRELYLWNEFHGNAAVIKKYSQLPSEYKIKAVIEHAPKINDDCVEDELVAPLPAILYPSKRRYTILQKSTNKQLYQIGPTIAYAPDYYDKNQHQEEKKRLGKTLLVFPTHSATWSKAKYDIHSFCKRIKDIGKDFKTIRICVYWMDIILYQTHKIYEKYGFECVTAGHLLDPLFLSHLRSIIKSADLAISNNYGSQVLYSVFLGVPHYFFKDESIQYTVPKGHKERQENFFYNNPDGQKIYKAFKTLKNDITQEQNDLVDYYLGTNAVKSVKEMQNILNETEGLYQAGNYPKYNRKTASVFRWKRKRLSLTLSLLFRKIKKYFRSYCLQNKLNFN
jgi:hypothetical protein